MTTKSLMDNIEQQHLIDLEDQPILKETRPLRNGQRRLFGSVRRSSHVDNNNGMIEQMRICSWPVKGLMWLILTGGFIAFIYYASKIVTYK